MVWRPGATDEEREAEQLMAWKAGASFVHAADPSTVVIEAWDDEIPQPTRTDDFAAGVRRTRAMIGPGALRALNLLVFAAAVLGA